MGLLRRGSGLSGGCRRYAWDAFFVGPLETNIGRSLIYIWFGQGMARIVFVVYIFFSSHSFSILGDGSAQVMWVIIGRGVVW